MNEKDRLSYWKTIGLAALSAAFVLVLTELLVRGLSGTHAAPSITFVRAIGYTASGACLLVVACGIVVVLRHRSRCALEPDWFLEANAKRSEDALSDESARAAPLRFVRRLFGAPQFIVGEAVEIRSLDEIRRTLDATGCLDGLPFMSEMAALCGTRARVYRSIDKIYDYGGKKDLRRMKDAYLLTGTRCNGAGHSGCQAGCHIIWKGAWLRAENAERAAIDRLAPRLEPGPVASSTTSGGRYFCQYTQLVASSGPLSRFDWRQDVRPLIAGNVTTMAFLVAMATRLFAIVQGWRGGVGYPPIVISEGESSPRIDLDLEVGEPVRVLTSKEIAPTLNKHGRNRGLWFDRGMLHYSGQSYRVHARVHQIIDDATGKMLSMKTPSVILEGVAAPGELLRFCAQHDYIFWREAWLARVNERSEDRRAQWK